MGMKNAICLPIHKNWKYLQDCCDLINEEWPRSNTARLRGLQSSCDDLPTSLVLVQFYEENQEQVIGHSKLSPIHNIPDSCFIESVVISKHHRGKGWGRYIMNETENYIKSLGKTLIYLTTTDKFEFYEKLGYEQCEPIVIYGGKIPCNFLPSFVSTNRLPNIVSEKQIVSAPPPPPPPLLPLQSKSATPHMRKIHMKKVLR